jgi:hypothetical protein
MLNGQCIELSIIRGSMLFHPASPVLEQCFSLQLCLRNILAALIGKSDSNMVTTPF